MPDAYDNIDDNDPPDESQVLKELRKKAERTSEAEARVAALEAQVAILSSGVSDLTPQKQKALLAAHEGDLTPEALRQTAVALGFAAEQEQAPQVPADEREAIERQQQATGGAPPSAGTPTDLDEIIRQAKTPEDLARILEGAGIVTNIE